MCLYLPNEAEIKLLSQKEIEYLRSPENFSIDYSYVLKHKIKSKVKALNDELVLLERAGLIEFSKITEISKIEQSSKQASFSKREWTGGDFNSHHSGDITRKNYLFSNERYWSNVKEIHKLKDTVPSYPRCGKRCFCIRIATLLS